METIKGKSVCGGIAFGKIFFFQRENQIVEKKPITDVGNELNRVLYALNKATFELKELYEKAIHEVGENEASIFQIHQMLLEDSDFSNSINSIICTERVNAEYAVSLAGHKLISQFSNMSDDYMKERAVDFEDITDRLISVLSGVEPKNTILGENLIIAANDLTPSETIQLDKSKVLAFVTRDGSSNSHTSILARSLNIPAIVNLGDPLKNEYDTMNAIIDGNSGCVYIDPDQRTIERYKKISLEEEDKLFIMQELKGKENITLDGRSIKIAANIGRPEDLSKVIENDAGGIGLFRSEFLYLESKSFPSEEEQYLAYRTVVQGMDGKEVIIRTLDIGADKQVDYFNLSKEENPALGYRAIRICLTETKTFKTQLRALYRASAFGNLAIMFPMIISVDEVLQIKEIVNQVKEELIQDNISFSENVKLGIMIETPAAVMISDLLAKEVDFFSIGTNDLTQFTLAIDRQNSRLDQFYDFYHPAVIRSIQLVTENAHKNNIWVGICGELAADLNMTESFLAMGIDELSVSPYAVLKLRKKIRETSVVSKIDDKSDIDD